MEAPWVSLLNIHLLKCGGYRSRTLPSRPLNALHAQTASLPNESVVYDLGARTFFPSISHQALMALKMAKSADPSATRLKPVTNDS